ncbi:hypothetical protein LWC34_31670 [Kibdelosporangium philippinense]|uniref:Uncharacterized protein n=1 Tax=Kibdelosporangium philippinense TaxID=211113 RepID=A0ABS8ZL38_9PSEU|nr:hypothetical protein [Kibdelosporangium philippinense]MCE7007346.1 hypothetical protein [Kibdelosporangium philippinense]
MRAHPVVWTAKLLGAAVRIPDHRALSCADDNAEKAIGDAPPHNVPVYERDQQIDNGTNWIEYRWRIPFSLAPQRFAIVYTKSKSTAQASRKYIDSCPRVPWRRA